MDDLLPIPEPVLVRAFDRRIAMERKGLIIAVVLTVLFTANVTIALIYIVQAWRDQQFLYGALWSLLLWINGKSLIDAAKNWEYRLGAIDATKVSKEAFLTLGDSEAKMTWQIEITRAMIDLAAATANYDMAKERERADKDGA